MNGRETAAAERILDHRRAVHLVDGVTIREALLGNKTALTELERDAVISICDTNGLDRDITAQGLGIARSTLDKAIAARRTARPATERQALATALIEPARALVDAVHEHDADAVADVLGQFAGMNLTGWHAFAIVLADMAAAVDEGADDDR